MDIWFQNIGRLRRKCTFFQVQLSKNCNDPPSAIIQSEGVGNGEEEPRDKVCETADAPASFEADMWNYFGFLVRRGRRKGDGQTGNHLQTQLDWNHNAPTALF